MEVRPYGLWQSNISVASIFNQPSAPAFPFRNGGHLFWLQALPEQGGRIALMREELEDSICLTPEDFNIRSKVHEYGGCCFCVCADAIVFNNFSDGGLYLQKLESDCPPELICACPEGTVGFADLVFLQSFNTVVAVAERSREGLENQNLLVAVNLSDPEAGIHQLVTGADFYACPVFDQRKNRLAWFEWDHPYMPWDQSRLCVADLLLDNSQLSAQQVSVIVDQENKSVCQPGFLSDGSLIFSSDDSSNDWWNLYRWYSGKVTQLTEDKCEYGEAHWVFGQRRWCQVSDDMLVAVVTCHSGDQLVEINIDTDLLPKTLYKSASICHLNCSAEQILMVVTAEDRYGEIIQLEPQSATTSSVGPQSAITSPFGYSVAEPIEYPTRDGEKCWAYFYPPHNSKYQAPAGALPPLLVMVHGGPTSRTNAAFNPLRQYFTSLGFAILDVNHRGSTGYGRAYRQRLQGGWGEIDVMDIADGIEYLISIDRVDKNQIFIRGGSAGGYAVLRALTRYADLFAGGACYYGIGNLITLCEITHKFEGRYTDQLVGEVFDPETARMPGSLYIERSPIFEIEQLQAPLIIFQGELDKIVPPEVSREVVSALQARGIHYSYTEYEGEGHGFRRTETRIDSLEKEAGFFRDIINRNLN